MLALTPPGEELELHVNLLRHGRRTCHARAPACARLRAARMCPTGADVRLSSGTAYDRVGGSAGRALKALTAHAIDRGPSSAGSPRAVSTPLHGP